MSILTVKNLSFSYKNQAILSDINFSINSGEVICILGKNGVGKTTLFRCILNTLHEYTGEIFFNNLLSKKLAIKERAKNIAYVSQSHEIIFSYSVFQVILMGTNAQMGFFSTPGKKEEKIVDEIINMLKISHIADKMYNQISGGERQLVLIARALAQKSSILIMDEPTANLDFGNQFDIMRKIKTLAKDNYSVIFSSHNPTHALTHADKVLILNNGKIEKFGVPTEILTKDVLESIYNVNISVNNVKINNENYPVIIPY